MRVCFLFMSTNNFRKEKLVPQVSCEILVDRKSRKMYSVHIYLSIFFFQFSNSFAKNQKNLSQVKIFQKNFRFFFVESIYLKNK